MGLRLRLADVAAGLRLSRTRAGAAHRPAPRHCASIRSSIAARRSGPAWCSGSTAAACAAASPFGSPRGARGDRRLSARARAGDDGLSWKRCGGSSSKSEARRQVRALCFIVDRSHVQYAGRLTLAECVHTCGRVTAARVPIATTCWRRCRRWKRSAIARPICIFAERLRARTTAIRDQEPARSSGAGIRALPDVARSSAPRQAGRSLARCAFCKRRRNSAFRRKARRDRIEHFDQDGARIAPQRAARPEQSGIERDRHAGQPESRHRGRRRPASSAALRPADAACLPERSRSCRPRAASRRAAAVMLASACDASRGRSGSSAPWSRASRTTAATSARA